MSTSKTLTPHLSLVPSVTELLPPTPQSSSPSPNGDPNKRSPSPPTPVPAPAALPPLPPPPIAPYPWLWQCHACRAVYRLATTRRCLECSHEMCSSVNSQASASGRKGRKRPAQGGPCRAEFDYTGWTAWGRWRRREAPEADLTLVREREREREREEAFVLGRHECWTDCDHPSECHHAKHMASVEGRGERIRVRAAMQGVIDARLSAAEEVSEESRSRRASVEGGAAGKASPPFSAPDTHVLAPPSESLYTFFADVEDPDDFAATAREPDLDFDDVDLADLLDEDDGDVDAGGGDVAAAHLAKQQRRSKLKVAQLTGFDSFLPLDAAGANITLINGHGKAVPEEAASDLAVEGVVADINGPGSVGWWVQHQQRPRKRRKCISKVLKTPEVAGEDDWENWSDSSSSSEDDQEERKASTGEQDLAQLIRLRSAFMKGDDLDSDDIV